MSFKLLFPFLMLLTINPAWAQGGSENAAWEAGVLVGKILPHQIEGVTEIMTLGGVQGAYNLGDKTYVESFFHGGRGSGQDWKNLGVSFRMDQPLEGFLVSAYGGAHYLMHKGGGFSEKSDVGGHVGGAAMTGIGGPTWLRFDMNFSFGPGTSLFISMALLLRY